MKIVSVERLVPQDHLLRKIDSAALRRTVEEIRMNVAYRWFGGYLLNEPIPYFATVSYNFRHRFTQDTIEKVFT